MTRRETVRPTHLALLVLIVLLGTGLRLYELDADSLWIDEIVTAIWAQLDPHSLLSFVASGAGQGVQMPLSFIVAHILTSSLGASEFILRLPAMLLGSLSVLLIYKVGEMLWTRAVGLTAAFLLAISPYHVQYSQEARHYALMVFLALMSLIFLIKAVRRNGPGLWVGFTICTSLGLYNHYFAFLFLPAEVALAAWLIADNWRSRRGTPHVAPQGGRFTGPRPNRQLLALCLSLLVVGLSLLPWASPMLKLFSSQAASGGLEPSSASVWSLLVFWRDVLLSFSGVGGLWLVVWLGLFAVGLARSSARATGLVLLGIATPVMSLVVRKPDHFLAPRYLLFWLPFYLLAVAQGLNAVASLVGERLLPTTFKGRCLTATQVLAIVLFGALSIVPLEQYYRWDKEDWRAAAAHLSQNLGPSDIIIADGQGYGGGGDSGRTLKGLSYYFPPSYQATTMLAVESGLADKVRDLPDAHAQVWGVLWHSSELVDPVQLDEEVEILQMPGVAIVTQPRSKGDLLENTASVLEAMAVIQPGGVGRFDLHLALAELYDATDRQEDAATQLELAKGVQPADEDAAIHLAKSYQALGRSEDALQEYLLFLQTPSAQSDIQWRRDAYWGLAGTYEQLGRLDQAMEACREVLSLDPDYWPAYRRLGDVHRELGEPGEALSAYRRALELEPQNAWLHLLVGRAYLAIGRIEEAMRSYEQALSIDPNNESARAELASLSQLLEEDIAHPLFRTLGGHINLLGYDLSPATLEAGSSLQVTLWWQALADMDKDYTAFIHVVAADGRLWAQADSLLEHDGLFTSDWQIGLPTEGAYQLQIPFEAARGDYTVLVGIYDWETGQRLPVWDDLGRRQADDAVVIGTITLADPYIGD